MNDFGYADGKIRLKKTREGNYTDCFGRLYTANEAVKKKLLYPNRYILEE